MIIGEKREEVIANIQAATRRCDYNCKVEVDDPVLTPEDYAMVQERYQKRNPADGSPTIGYRVNNRIARGIANLATRMVNVDSSVEGLENATRIEGGAVVTSNHFSPVDNTVVRRMVNRAGRSRLPIVIADENLAMDGLFGYLTNYADTIPLCKSRRYVAHDFNDLLQREFDDGNFVLIYPEQEMWFNYRKPRPCKRGAYYYAASHDVPVVSCFVEIRDKEKLERPNFVEVSYVIHVLDPIFPDPGLTDRENSIMMCDRDYAQKAVAYEEAYGKALNYHFEIGDIAGWVPTDEEREAVEERDSQELCATA